MSIADVEQAMNFIDKQHYAIKRIPLNKKFVKRWQDDRYHDGADNVLKEIRTLSRLEHANIVRYHNAWIERPVVETPDLSPYVTAATASNLPGSNQRKLLMDGRALSTLPQPRSRQQDPVATEKSDGIVFGDASDASRPHISQHELAKDSVSQSTISLTNSSIFSDGRSHNARPPFSAPNHDSSFVLHVQMSIHPLTLTSYLSIAHHHDNPISSTKRHCYHLLPTLRILLGILCGLQYLHALGIVHRDIKPSNILISEFTGLASPVNGFYDVGSCPSCSLSTPYFINPRIADFGLVAEITRGKDADGQHTHLKRIVGTEMYRPRHSPEEQFSPTRIDESLDVFALGIVFFEMLYRFGTKMERHDCLSNLHRAGLPEDFAAQLDQEFAGAGQEISDCILGMVEPNPDARWTCEEVRVKVEEMHDRMQSM